MRRIWIAILAGLLLCMTLTAGTAEGGETVSFGKLTVPADAESIDLGKVAVSGSGYPEFYDFLAQLPNLKHVDMYSTKIPRKRIEQLAERFPEVEFG